MPQQQNQMSHMPYEKWRDELRRLVAEKTGQHLTDVSVNDMQAEVSWRAGNTPEKTFEENFKSL